MPNEAQATSELTNLLRRLGLWPYKVPDTSANHPQGGEPDIIFLDIPVIIEVKMFGAPSEKFGNANFPFSNLRADQRAYLQMFEREHHSYLALGTRHGRAGNRNNPRHLWLIPYTDWLSIEARVQPIRKSLPLTWEPRCGDIYAIQDLWDYELWWAGGCWRLPPEHCFNAFVTRKDERNLEQMRSTWNALKQR